MQKIAKVISVLCLSLFLISCNNAKNTVSVTKTVESGYVFKIQNVGFVINEDPSEKIKILKAKSDSFEAQSCAMQGKDKTYIYSGFTLTVNETDVSRLVSILLTDDSVETEEGLYIGKDKKDVKKLYGEPSITGKNEFIYTKGDMELYIIFRADKVVSIEYKTKGEAC